MGLSEYLDAQTAVLGSLLLEPEKLTGEIMRRVSAEDFSRTELRTLYKAARALFMAGEPIDPVVLVSRCGDAYSKTVAEILTATPTAANVHAYIDVLHDEASLRRMQTLAMQMVNAATADEARALLGKAESEIVKRPGIKVVSLRDGLGAFLDRQADPTPPDYLDWGFPQFAGRISATLGDFVLLGADSSVGKTALALQFAFGFARGGRRVGFFSFETSAEKLIDRVVAQQAQVTLPKIKLKGLSAADAKEVAALGERSYDYCMDVIPCAGASVADIRALTLAGRYSVIFVDYVQLCEEDAEVRWEKVSKISMGLHTLSQQLGVAVIGLSQMTLPDKSKKKSLPSKDDLRESKQLKQDADVIMLMSLANAEDTEGPRNFVIDKNKDGPLGRFLLDFAPETLTFTPHVKTKGEAYRETQHAIAEQKRAEQAARRAGIDGQVRFTEQPGGVPEAFGEGG